MAKVMTYVMVYKTSSGETLLQIPALRGDVAGNKYPAGFTGNAPAATLTTSGGRTYPDPLHGVWGLIAAASRKRVSKLHYTDTAIYIRVPDRVLPGIIGNATIRHGL